MSKIVNHRNLAFVVALSFYGCDNDNPEIVDVDPPEIAVTAPAYDEFLLAGGPAYFEAVFTDNIELGSYAIDIHNVFDGHAHGRIAQPQEDPSLLKWSYKQSFAISPGVKNYDAQLHDEIEIPANAMAGPYHFIVQAVDASGNATSYADGSTVELEVYVTNDSQPLAVITNLENDELEIEVNQMFNVEGSITDPTTGAYAGIHSVQVILGEEHAHNQEHTHDGRISEEHQVLVDAVFEDSALVPFLSDGAVQLAPLFQDINFVLSTEQFNDLISENIDHLLLTIKAFDEQGNITFLFTDVHVHTN